MKQFVVVKEDTVSLNDIPVEKDDIAIVEEAGETTTQLFFIKLWQKIGLKNTDFEDFDVTRTGDAYPKKICNVCHKLLDTTKFDRNQNGVNNRPVRRPSCKDCRKLIDGTGVSGADKAKWNKIKPNYVPFECPICRKRTIPGVTSKVVLDHNHSDGTVREWLCDSCNTGIGRFKDDIGILKRAMEYLEKEN